LKINISGKSIFVFLIKGFNSKAEEIIIEKNKIAFITLKTNSARLFFGGGK